MTIHKISGPPGTGKTTRLLNILDEILAKGTDPADVVFTTFTKAGANEARERAQKRFGLSPARLPWFRTLHSICYQQMPKDRGVMGPADWCSIGRMIGVPFTLRSLPGEGLPTGATKGDAMSLLLSIERVSMRTPEEVWRLRDSWAGAFPNLTFQEYLHFRRTLAEFKEANGKIDYTDMLETFLRPDVQTVGASYVIVDEAQDLSVLQWRVVEKLWQGASRVYVAGDDDQAIHEWGGASPNHFIDLEAQHNEVLGQSYRVPAKVHEVAGAVASRIVKRIPKEYRPREETGEVIRVSDPDQLTELKRGGSWLLLARNQFHIPILSGLCMRMGVPFISPNEDKKLRNALLAVRTWRTITETMSCVSKDEVENLYAFMSQRDRVERGAKTKVSKDTVVRAWDHKILASDFGLLAPKTMPWEKALDMIPPEFLGYLKAATSPNTPESSIEISTIHGAKGREADNVVLLTDMSKRTAESFAKNPDAEHRVWYVGATRARKRLFIVNPIITQQGYPL